MHAYAGTIFDSDTFKSGAESHHISILLAATNHQGQNGFAERTWQAIRLFAFSFCTHARVDFSFMHFVLQAVYQVPNNLHICGLFIHDESSLTKDRPTCPYELWYQCRARSSSFRVLFCPAVAKVFVGHDAITNRTLTPCNIIQQGVQGIYIVFSDYQAGWEIYVPVTGQILNSLDVQFDKEFASSLAYPNQLF